MSIPELIIELLQSYLQFLSIIAWPVVVLLIFGVLWFTVKRFFQSVTPGKRIPVTWKGMYTLISNLESQLLSQHPQTPEDRHRLDIVKHELRVAREAAENRDHHTMIQSIATLTQMASQNDSQAQQWNINFQQKHAQIPPQPNISSSDHTVNE